jgi:SAM-dependent methyltransferase
MKKKPGSKEIEAALKAAISDFHATEYAIRHKKLIRPQASTIKQIETLVSCLPPNGKYCDIGVGIGIVARTMLKLGYSVSFVEGTKGESWGQRLQPLVDAGAVGFHAYVGADRIPCPDEDVDAVYAADVIEHLPFTPVIFVEELLRIVRKGGYLVLATPNAVRLPVRLKTFLGYSNWPHLSTFIDHPREYPAHAGHHKEYTADELAMLMERFSLTNVGIEYVEDRLGRSGMISSFSDLETIDRPHIELKISSLRQYPFELARFGAYALTKAIPKLRSMIIVRGMKT